MSLAVNLGQTHPESKYIGYSEFSNLCILLLLDMCLGNFCCLAFILQGKLQEYLSAWAVEMLATGWDLIASIAKTAVNLRRTHIAVQGDDLDGNIKVEDMEIPAPGEEADQASRGQKRKRKGKEKRPSQPVKSYPTRERAKAEAEIVAEVQCLLDATCHVPDALCNKSCSNVASEPTQALGCFMLVVYCVQVYKTQGCQATQDMWQAC